MVLHEAARFDTVRLVIIAFGRRAGAMTEQTGGNANVGRVVDRDARRSAISKQVWINGLAQTFTRARHNTVIDSIVGHWGSVHRQPKRIACSASARTAQRQNGRSMILEINPEVGHQHFGPRFLDRVPCFCLGGGNLDPPPIASLNQCTVENETSKVSQSKLTTCEQPDHQSITVGFVPT